MRCVIIKPDTGVVEMHVPGDKPPETLQFVESEPGERVKVLMATDQGFHRTVYQAFEARDGYGNQYWIYLLKEK